MTWSLRAALFLCTAACFSGCQRSDRDMIPVLAPEHASAYAQDDASTDRVLLAYADLHGSLRQSAGASARWEPRYYRLPADSSWAAVRAQLESQAADAGWEPDSTIAEPGTGYLRRAWRKGSQRIAAAYVEPPPGKEGAIVLVVLTPNEP